MALAQLEDDEAQAKAVLARRRTRLASMALLMPAVIALIILFILPLVRIGYQSLTEPSTGFSNYKALFTDGYTVKVLTRTLLICALVTLIAGLLAYPYAYALTVVSPRMRAVLFTIVLLPFWTSALARNYAWIVLFQNGGLVERVLSYLGFHNMILLGTTAAVAIVMSLTLLPFLIFPLYTSMQQIDRRLLLAARTLGATRTQAFFRVYFPLSLPGVIAGVTLVFVLSLGFYVTPALLGSAQNAFIAQLIVIKLTNLGDFGGAGALGIFVLGVTLIILFIGGRAAGLGAKSLGASTVGRSADNAEKKANDEVF